MAKKVIGFIKLQVPAGKANPAPPVGPALGQHGVNIAAFIKEFKLIFIRKNNISKLSSYNIVVFIKYAFSEMLNKLIISRLFFFYYFMCYDIGIGYVCVSFLKH